MRGPEPGGWPYSVVRSDPLNYVDGTRATLGASSGRATKLAADDSLRDDSALLRPNEVARLLSVSRAWVYDAARTGRIPSVRLGGPDGPLRFIAEDLERWLADARAAWLPGHGLSTSPEVPRAPVLAKGSVAPAFEQQSLR